MKAVAQAGVSCQHPTQGFLSRCRTVHLCPALLTGSKAGPLLLKALKTGCAKVLDTTFLGSGGVLITAQMPGGLKHSGGLLNGLCWERCIFWLDTQPHPHPNEIRLICRGRVPPLTSSLLLSFRVPVVSTAPSLPKGADAVPFLAKYGLYQTA